jgi:hypothetical protein
LLKTIICECSGHVPHLWPLDISVTWKFAFSRHSFRALHARRSLDVLVTLTGGWWKELLITSVATGFKSRDTSTRPGAGDFWIVLARCSRKCSSGMPSKSKDCWEDGSPFVHHYNRANQHVQLWHPLFEALTTGWWHKDVQFVHCEWLRRTSLWDEKR